MLVRRLIAAASSPVLPILTLVVKYVLEAEGYSCVEATLGRGERLFCHSQTCRPSIILRGELGRKYSSRLIDNERSNILWLCGGPGLAKRRMRLGWPRAAGLASTLYSGEEMLSDPSAPWCTVAFDLAQISSAFVDTSRSIEGEER